MTQNMAAMSTVSGTTDMFLNKLTQPTNTTHLSYLNLFTINTIQHK